MGVLSGRKVNNDERRTLLSPANNDEKTMSSPSPANNDEKTALDSLSELSLNQF